MQKFEGTIFCLATALPAASSYLVKYCLWRLFVREPAARYPKEGELCNFKHAVNRVIHWPLCALCQTAHNGSLSTPEATQEVLPINPPGPMTLRDIVARRGHPNGTLSSLCLGCYCSGGSCLDFAKLVGSHLNDRVLLVTIC
jgi:hypothetical protein